MKDPWEPGRSRYATDAEFDLVKAQAHATLIDAMALALLTGQRPLGHRDNWVDSSHHRQDQRMALRHSQRLPDSERKRHTSTILMTDAWLRKGLVLACWAQLTDTYFFE